MHRLLNDLQLKEAGKLTALRRLAIDGFEFTIDKDGPDAFRNYVRYTASLTYKQWVIANEGETSEQVAKDRLAREISWAMYGDMEKLIPAMYHALFDKDFDKAVEILDCMAQDVRGK